MYLDFNAGGKDYKLRLDTLHIVGLEKSIGKNPLSIFGKGEDMPSVTTMVNILWYSLQRFNHGITLQDAYKVFDAYLADGHTVTDFISIIIDIYKVSGLMRDDKEEDTEKN